MAFLFHCSLLNFISLDMSMDEHGMQGTRLVFKS